MSNTLRTAAAGLLRGLPWLLLAVVPSAALAQDREYRIGPEPEWVTPLELQRLDHGAGTQGNGGAFYHLVDAQLRLDGRTASRYARYAAEVTGPAGLESLANIEIEFDPSYQALALHAVRLHRDGRVIDKLAGADVRVLQRERELEQFMFDGSKTASIFLDDVRIGDIVDYAYSVHGANPVFGGMHHGSMRVGWSSPAGRVHVRLVAPAGVLHTVRTRNLQLQPLVRRIGGQVEYVLDQAGTAALRDEPAAPAWYQPYPVLEWTSHADWASVVRWALPLYAVPERVGPGVQEVIATLAAAHADPAERALAALRFVQSDVRYLGIEVGPGSHAPSPPDLVLERRYGDCKDKTLLLLTLLKGLGVPAQAALVDAEGLPDPTLPLPSPGAFDHVMVLAHVGAERLWLDPTLWPQSGTIGRLHLPDLGHALVVHPATKALAPMTSELRPQSRRSTYVELDASAGYDVDATYVVRSVYEGERADDARSVHADGNPAKLAEDYQHFYAAYYPGIQRTAALETEDDPAANRFTVIERYRIPAAWQRNDDAARFELDIGVHDLVDQLPGNVSPQRSWPRALPWPYDSTQVTEVRLPEPWPFDSSPVRIEDSAFTFERSIEARGATLVLTDRFRTLADHVAAADVPRHLDNLDRVRAVMSDVLYLEDAVAPSWWQRINWLALLVALLAVAASIFGAIRVYGWDPARRPPPPTRDLQGIRGWLLLPAIGVGLGPLVYLATATSYGWLFDPAEWSALATPGNADYHPMWAPVLLFDMAGHFALLVFSILLAVLFFQKRSSVPAVYIAVNMAALGYMLVSTVGAFMVPMEAAERTASVGQFVQSALITLLWCAYFIRSRRVESTFIHARDGRVVSRAPMTLDAMADVRPAKDPPPHTLAATEPA